MSCLRLVARLVVVRLVVVGRLVVVVRIVVVGLLVVVVPLVVGQAVFAQVLLCSLRQSFLTFEKYFSLLTFLHPSPPNLQL